MSTKLILSSRLAIVASRLLRGCSTLMLRLPIMIGEWTCLPSRPKVLSPRRVVGGDVYPHDVILFITHHQLKGDEIGGHDSCSLRLNRLVIQFSQQDNPPLVFFWCFCCEYLVPQRCAGIAIVGNFHFRQNRTPNPHLCQPLGFKCQSVSPSTTNVPCCNGEGPTTPQQRGCQRSRHCHDP
jgi:hypothetical protein